ncbi:hypothetical protein [Streptomyces sp. NPDC048172]|uniref:hypothetical protein n=1 Tax=Streptomyces sp. NPDC048172 TaxID=3365505 RepID=UPI00372180AD
MRLPPDAAAIITALLPPGTPGREELLRQLPHTHVVRRCGCGCATLDLTVDRTAASPAPVEDGDAASASFRPPAQLTAATIVLLTSDGYLSCLEVYSVSDTPITAWPAPDALVLEQ